MKKSMLSIVLSVVFVFSLSAYAGHGKSKLELRMWNNSFFSVEIDGKYYSSETSKFKVENLAPGRHYIKVVQKKRRHNGFHAHVAFKGYVDIPAKSKVVAKISKHRKLKVVKVRPLRARHSGQGHNSHQYSGEYGSNSYSNTAENAHHSTECYHTPIMSEVSFHQLKSTIRRTSFDSKKRKIAKQAIKYNKVSSEQVYELMEMLSYDSSKLELAKFAFAYTVDKQNYFVVNNAFTFSSSISSLNHYINSYPI